MSDTHQMVSFWTCPNCFAVMRETYWADVLVTSDGRWRWTDPAVSSRPKHTCPDDTEHWGVIKTQAQLDSELRDQALFRKQYLELLTDIWDAMYPDEPDSWEYPAQIVRHARGHIEERVEAIKALHVISNFWALHDKSQNDHRNAEEPLSYARKILRELNIPTIEFKSLTVLPKKPGESEDQS